MNGFLDKAFNWCRSYVTITFLGVVAFIIFLTFFTDNSLMKRLEYEREISRMKEEIKQNTDTLHHYEILNSNLTTDREEMERIVRERYHMQRANEDVYLFE